MESIKYEGLAAQKAAHTTFIDRLREIDLDEMDDNQDEHLEDLVDFLLEWLINHIKILDKKIPVKPGY
jgi:hemerythrin